MTRVLITGGAGFIGSHLVQAYQEAGFKVGIIDIKPISSLNYKLKNSLYFQQDLTKNGLEAIIVQFKPAIINHHAARIKVAESMLKPIDYEKINVLATLKLLDLAKQYKVKQFIFPSSVAVYGSQMRNGKAHTFPIKEICDINPESFYGLQKAIAEKYISLYRQDFVTTFFRYANVYGPGQDSSAEGGVVAIFAKNIVQNLPSVIYGDGNQSRDFIYVKDVALANVLASQKTCKGLMNVSSAEAITIKDLYKQMLKIQSKSLNLEYQAKRPGDIIESRLDNTLIKQSLSWQPLNSLKQGLKATIEYFENF